MATKGRKPNPRNLRLVRGNAGRRPLPEDEPGPEAEAELPVPPDHLSEEAKAEWHRTGEELIAAGLLTKLDRTAFTLYCSAWARWADAEEKLRLTGVVIRAPSGYPIQSPYLAIANKALEQMMKILVEFGMSPSSRTRVKPAARKKVNPLDEFLNANSS